MTVLRTLASAAFRVLRVVLLLFAIVVGAGATAYFAGVTIPVLDRDDPRIFSTWNGTGAVPASVHQTASLRRNDGRPELTLSLAMADVSATLSRFLDGGRTEIVACGTQSLFFHRIDGLELSVNDTDIRVIGRAVLELAGLAVGQDDWPMRAEFGVTHDATTLRLLPRSIEIAGLPDPLVSPIAQGLSEIHVTREQMLDRLSQALPARIARRLDAERDALDLRIVEVSPRGAGDRLYLTVTMAADEAAMLRLMGWTLVDGLANLLSGATPAEAQWFKDLGKTLENAGRLIGQGLAEGKTPEEILRETLAGFSDCQLVAAPLAPAEP